MFTGGERARDDKMKKINKNKTKWNEYMREYNQRPKAKATRQKYQKTPKTKVLKKIADRK